MELKLSRPHDAVSMNELVLFNALPELHVVFDVGARMQMDASTVPSVVDYLELKPNATYHLFEPNPKYAEELRRATAGKQNVIVNEFGLGDEETTQAYSESFQAFSGGEAYTGDGAMLQLKTLDQYCADNNIERIDFLKIDTEGYDYKVLLGASDMLKNIRFIQYEEWDDPEEFRDLLEQQFHMEEIGFRNVICVNKTWS